jgi:hypothetical protein
MALPALQALPVAMPPVATENGSGAILIVGMGLGINLRWTIAQKAFGFQLAI